MTQTQAISAPAPRRAALPLWQLGDGAPPAGSFIAVVPGADAPLISLALPGTLKGRAREDVARRQAQDRLGASAPLEVRPARLGGAEGWTRVAVTDRAQVLIWRAGLGAGASRCRAILPDYATLPAAPGVWVIAHDGAAIRARLGPQDAFSVEPALAAPMLAQALQHANASNTMPRAILWLGTRDPQLEGLFEGLTLEHQASDLPVSLTPQAFAHDEMAIDFARDPRADAEAIEGQVRRLLWPVILLGLGCAGWVGATAMAAQQDRAIAAALTAQTLDAARRDLLGAAPILDLNVQVTRAIAARRGAVQSPDAPVRPLALLRSVSGVLTGQARIEAVAFSAATDGVVFDIIVDDFRALDGVQAALAAAGMRVEITRSGIDAGGGVAASLTVFGGVP